MLYFSLAQNCIDYNKLYIGQLPLSITEPFIRDVLSKFTEVKDVRIIKGDARGTFDRFCYAFSMIKGNDEICSQVIKKVNEQYPEWKLNVKVDNDRFKFMQQPQQNNPRQGNQGGNFPHHGHQNQNHGEMNYERKSHQQDYYQKPSYYQNQPMYQQYPSQSNNYSSQNQQFYQSSHQHHQHQYQNVSNEPQKIVGEKNHRILVRQIWLGGIPQLCDKQYMHQLMSQFGMIQNLEIFPKFAFIKFRMVEQATLAFQRAERIFNMFGNPPGFRIFFSDPSRRANIVGNHYEYDRQSPFLPILFLGFPPVTSATIDLDLMKSVCQKYGNIVNSYMRKNSNSQTRSYFLFTFDNIKSAIKAKIELNKRRDLLGDKRVEVTLLLDEEVVLRGRDLSYTQKMFQSEGGNPIEKKKPSVQKNFTDRERERPPYQNYPPKQVPPITNVPNMSYGGMYQPPPGMYYPGYVYPQTTQGQPNYPISEGYFPPERYFEQGLNKGHEANRPSDVHQFLQSVLDKPSNERQLQNFNIQRKPIKTSSNNDQNVSDIVSKMLGVEKEAQVNDKERQVTWSGFLTWKGVKRVAVDGHTEQKQPEDYVINIGNLIQPKDIVRKENSTMILAPQSPLHEPLFKQYVKALRGRAGVCVTTHFLMYILGKSKQCDQIREIRDNELLVVMEKPSLISVIRDKLQKCEQLK